MTHVRQSGSDQLDGLPDALTVEDVAAVLQVCTRSVRRMVARRVLPAPTRFGRLARWPKETIRNALCG